MLSPSPALKEQGTRKKRVLCEAYRNESGKTKKEENEKGKRKDRDRKKGKGRQTGQSEVRQSNGKQGKENSTFSVKKEVLRRKECLFLSKRVFNAAQGGYKT